MSSPSAISLKGCQVIIDANAVNLLKSYINISEILDNVRIICIQNYEVILFLLFEQIEYSINWYNSFCELIQLVAKSQANKAQQSLGRIIDIHEIDPKESQAFRHFKVACLWNEIPIEEWATFDTLQPDLGLSVQEIIAAMEDQLDLVNCEILYMFLKDKVAEEWDSRMQNYFIDFDIPNCNEDNLQSFNHLNERNLLNNLNLQLLDYDQATILGDMIDSFKLIYLQKLQIVLETVKLSQQQDSFQNESAFKGVFESSQSDYFKHNDFNIDNDQIQGDFFSRVSSPANIEDFIPGKVINFSNYINDENQNLLPEIQLAETRKDDYPTSFQEIQHEEVFPNIEQLDNTVENQQFYYTQPQIKKEQQKGKIDIRPIQNDIYNIYLDTIEEDPSDQEASIDFRQSKTVKLYNDKFDDEPIAPYVYLAPAANESIITSISSKALKNENQHQYVERQRSKFRRRQIKIGISPPESETGWMRETCNCIII